MASIAVSLQGILEELKELRRITHNQEAIIKKLDAVTGQLSPPAKLPAQENNSKLRPPKIIQEALEQKGIDIFSTELDSGPEKIGELGKSERKVLDNIAKLMGERYTDISFFWTGLNLNILRVKPLAYL